MSSLTTGNPSLNQYSPASALLAAGGDFSNTAMDLLEDLQKKRRRVAEGDHVIRVGDKVENCHILSKGWISRQRTNEQGRTHITNVYLPGDFFSVHLGFRRWALYDFVALTDCEVSSVPSRELARAVGESAELAAALDWNALRTLNTVSEQAVGVALRRPPIRILHLLLEFWCRLMLVSLADDDGYVLPLTQAKLGEMCGLSTVTTNRAIKELRDVGLLETKGRKVMFPNPQRAYSAASFDGKLVQPFQSANSSQADRLTA